MSDFYRIAREVTDEVLGEGAYAAANKGNRHPQVAAQVAKSEGAKAMTDEKTNERIREEIEDAIARAIEAGWTREQVQNEVEYSLDAVEGDS